MEVLCQLSYGGPLNGGGFRPAVRLEKLMVGGEDLNLRRLRRQIYSLLPLATRAPPHELLARRRVRMIPKGQGHYKKTC